MSVGMRQRVHTGTPIEQPRSRLITLTLMNPSQERQTDRTSLPPGTGSSSRTSGVAGDHRRSHHTRPTSGLASFSPRSPKSKTASSPLASATTGQTTTVNENQPQGETNRCVNPYRSMKPVASARGRKNVLFSESGGEVKAEELMDSSDSEIYDHSYRSVRRANQTAFLAGANSADSSSEKGPVRITSASHRLRSPPAKSVPSPLVTSAPPRPSTSRQRQLIKTEESVGEAECTDTPQTPRSARQGSKSLARGRRVEPQSPRKSMEKSPARASRTPRRRRPKNRCLSTASVEDVISSSGSSSSMSSPRGPGTHRHAHSSQSSVDTIPLPPGTARSSAPDSAGSAVTQLSHTSSSYDPSSAWSMFEAHVKLIDDCSGSFTNVPRRTFVSSPVFQNVMADLYGRPEYSKTRAFLKLRTRVADVATYASRFLGRVKALHALRASSVTTDDDDDDDFDFDDFDGDGVKRKQPSAQTVENARRGWRILRNHVMEEAAKKRMSRPALAWDVIRHTLRAGSNLERARLDIYQRYGLVPMVLPDGRVVQENTMLSERARQALAIKSQKSVTASNTTTTNINNRQPRPSLTSMPTKRTLPYKAIEGFNGYSRSETM